MIEDIQSTESKLLAERPFFLVGSERSGTTMLALMLRHHPNVAWGGEMQYLVDYMPDGDDHAESVDFDALEIDRGVRMGRLVVDRRLTFANLAHSMFLQRTKGLGELVGATVHQNFDKLLKIWPNARFIHIVRDPRDVSRSVIRMGWAGNAWVGSERWIEAETLWEHLRSRLPDDRYFEVRFESLVNDSSSVLTKLCSFMGLKFDPLMLSYPEFTTYELPDPAICQAWKKNASQREIQLTEARVGSMLEERGYEHSGLGAWRPTALRLMLLRLQSRLTGIRRRIQRFGCGLYFSEYLARHLHLKWLHRRLIVRQQEIVNSILK